MAQRLRRRQNDHRASRSPDPPLRHRRDRQRQLALQKPRRRSRNPRSHRLRNPDQLRRCERYRQNPPLEGVKIGRRYGVKFERRLTGYVGAFNRLRGTSALMVACPLLLDATRPTAERSRSPSARCARWAYAVSWSAATPATTLHSAPLAGRTMFACLISRRVVYAPDAATEGLRSDRILAPASRRSLRDRALVGGTNAQRKNCRFC
ncbi:hypothetical protein ACVWZ6_007516 [Bradyrhizobium sp. GM6.1]